MEEPAPCPKCLVLLPAGQLEVGCPFCEPELGTGHRIFQRGPVWQDNLVPARRAVLLALLVWSGGLLAHVVVDMDRDDLWAIDEWRLGGDPSSADTDEDGLQDGWEARLGLRVDDPDGDGDGVSDLDEVRRRTDPMRKDSDGDGLEDSGERALGLDATSPDTDGDGIGDLVESDWLTRPDTADTDGDGLGDGAEILAGSDPLRSDSDGDGIPDGDETQEDCNGNGSPRLLDPDDDSDLMLDGLEDPLWRCQADFDLDGVLDGLEGALECVVLPDCDGDGLMDVNETEGFDPLDSDSFDVGLPDGTVWAFQSAGQPATRDLDEDAIPDGWESATGLIDWGDFEPDPGRTDLLVEFVRVQGPDSNRVAGPVSFGPVYGLVADAFEAGGIRMAWTETVITLPEETRPPFSIDHTTDYYADLLAQTVHATNPYVTTVVLNPQHDQGGTIHGGLAPMRGMIAAVDYGVQFELRYGFQNGSVRLTPLYESLIAGGQQEALQSLGFSGGGVTSDGRYGLDGPGYQLRWEPLWYGSPTIRWSGENTTTLVLDAIDLDEVGLANVIVHEMGHTLGLCHVDKAECRAGLEPDEQDRLKESAMVSVASDTLTLLPSEWQKVALFLTCPPSATVTLTAQGAPDAALLAAKYDLSGQTARECSEALQVRRSVEPATQARVFESGRSVSDAGALQGPGSDYDAPLAFQGPVLAEPEPMGRVVAFRYVAFYGPALVLAWPIGRMWWGART